MKRFRSITGHLAHTLAMMSMVAWSLLPSGMALADPQGAHNISGDVTINQSGDLTAITASNNSHIHWESFDTTPNETVQFIQPGETARVFNQITGPDPTKFDGSLFANGIVYIVNPAGVYFGNGAVVNVGGLYAAAANLSNADFINNVNRFTDASGNVVNSGTINSSLVAMVGRHVANYGVIYAPNGTVTMVAGNDILLGDRNRHFMVRLENAAAADPTAGVENAGTIDAQGGAVVWGAGDMYAVGIHQHAAGSVKAAQFHAQATGSDAVIAGSIDAANSSGKGGSVAITADHVTVSGSIDASGSTGGGTILVGGDYQGKGQLANAKQTTVQQGATLRADSTESGDAGKIIVWADDSAYFRGSISAVAPYGNGGFAEVSGKFNLDFSFWGGIDLRGINDTTGTLFLDPGKVGVLDNDVDNGVFTGGIIRDGTINTFLAADTADLSISTATAGSSGAEHFVMDGAAAIAWATARSLTFIGTLSADINGTITATNPAANFTVTGGAVTINNTVTLAGGDFTSNGTSFSNAGGPITTAGGDVIINNTGAISIGAAVATAGGAFTVNNTTTNAASFTAIGPITTAGGDVAITTAGAQRYAAGSINAGAGDVILTTTTTSGNIDEITRDQAVEITTTGKLTIDSDASVGNATGDDTNESSVPLLDIDVAEVDILTSGNSNIEVKNQGAAAVTVTQLRVANGFIRFDSVGQMNLADDSVDVTAGSGFVWLISDTGIDELNDNTEVKITTGSGANLRIDTPGNVGANDTASGELDVNVGGLWILIGQGTFGQPVGGTGSLYIDNTRAVTLNFPSLDIADGEVIVTTAAGVNFDADPRGFNLNFDGAGDLSVTGAAGSFSFADPINMNGGIATFISAGNIGSSTSPVNVIGAASYNFVANGGAGNIFLHTDLRDVIAGLLTDINPATFTPFVINGANTRFILTTDATDITIDGLRLPAQTGDFEFVLNTISGDINISESAISNTLLADQILNISADAGGIDLADSAVTASSGVLILNAGAGDISTADAGPHITSTNEVRLIATGSVGALGDPIFFAAVDHLTIDASDNVFVDGSETTQLTDLTLLVDPDGNPVYSLDNFLNDTFDLTTAANDLLINEMHAEIDVDTLLQTNTNYTLTAKSGDIILDTDAVIAGTGTVILTADAGNILTTVAGPHITTTGLVELHTPAGAVGDAVNNIFFDTITQLLIDVLDDIYVDGSSTSALTNLTLLLDPSGGTPVYSLLNFTNDTFDIVSTAAGNLLINAMNADSGNTNYSVTTRTGHLFVDDNGAVVVAGGIDGGDLGDGGIFAANGDVTLVAQQGSIFQESARDDFNIRTSATASTTTDRGPLVTLLAQGNGALAEGSIGGDFDADPLNAFNIQDSRRLVLEARDHLAVRGSTQALELLSLDLDPDGPFVATPIYSIANFTALTFDVDSLAGNLILNNITSTHTFTPTGAGSFLQGTSLAVRSRTGDMTVDNIDVSVLGNDPLSSRSVTLRTDAGDILLEDNAITVNSTSGNNGIGTVRLNSAQRIDEAAGNLNSTVKISTRGLVELYAYNAAEAGQAIGRGAAADEHLDITAVGLIAQAGMDLVDDGAFIGDANADVREVQTGSGGHTGGIFVFDRDGDISGLTLTNIDTFNGDIDLRTLLKLHLPSNAVVAGNEGIADDGDVTLFGGTGIDEPSVNAIAKVTAVDGQVLLFGAGPIGTSATNGAIDILAAMFAGSVTTVAGDFFVNDLDGDLIINSATDALTGTPIVGISTFDGAISVRTIGGLTVNSAIAAAGTGKAITLAANTDDLDSTDGDIFINAPVTTAAGDITVTAGDDQDDNITIGDGVSNAGFAAVTTVADGPDEDDDPDVIAANVTLSAGGTITFNNPGFNANADADFLDFGDMPGIDRNGDGDFLDPGDIAPEDLVGIVDVQNLEMIATAILVNSHAIFTTLEGLSSGDGNIGFGELAFNATNTTLNPTSGNNFDLFAFADAAIFFTGDVGAIDRFNSITATAANAILLQGNVFTSGGTQQYFGPVVVMLPDIHLDDTGPTRTAGIYFNSTIDAHNGVPGDEGLTVTVNRTAADIQANDDPQLPLISFGGNVGGAIDGTTRLLHLRLNAFDANADGDFNDAGDVGTIASGDYRTAVPTVATIVVARRDADGELITDPASPLNWTVNTIRDFSMGQNEKLTALGSITINANLGAAISPGAPSVILSDLNSNATITIDAGGSQVVLLNDGRTPLPGAAGAPDTGILRPVDDNDNALLDDFNPDTGLDFWARTGIHINNTSNVLLDDSAGPLPAWYSLVANNISGTGGIISGVNGIGTQTSLGVFPSSLTRDTADGPVVLDLIQPIGSFNLATAFPFPPEFPSLERVLRLALANPQFMADLFILTRDTTADQLLQRLQGSAFFDELANQSPGGRQIVTIDRIREQTALEVLESYRDLFYVQSTSNGDVIYEPRFDEIRATLADGLNAYRDATGDMPDDPRAFRSFFEQTGEHPPTQQLLQQLQRLYKQIAQLGLTDLEWSQALFAISSRITPEGLSPDFLNQAILNQPATY